MRCTNCDYPLWNLPARQCPECGDAFSPSDFEFKPGHVRFCCPDCRQTYYGTGLRGHLEPIEFDCVNCGRHLHMDGMVLLPAEGVKDIDTRLDPMPWLERKERGLAHAWFGTIGMAMTQPQRLVRAVPSSTATSSAWLFMIVSNLLYMSIGQLIPALVVSIVLIVELLPAPRPLTRLDPPGWVDAMAAQDDDGALYDPYTNPRHAMALQTIHGHPISGGLVSRYPASALARNDSYFEQFKGSSPDPLVRAGFEYILIQDYTIGGAKLLWEEGDQKLYHMVPAQGAGER